MGMLKIQSAPPAGVTLANEGGNWTLTGALVFQHIADIAAQPPDVSESIVLDLRWLAECDSGGLALLVHWYHRAEQGRGGIRYVNPPPNVMELAKLADLDFIFNTPPTDRMQAA